MMKNVGIIIPIRYSKWIYNLVIVKNKNGEIHLLNFRDLSKAYIKDNYPLLHMEFSHLASYYLGFDANT